MSSSLRVVIKSWYKIRYWGVVQMFKCLRSLRSKPKTGLNGLNQFHKTYASFFKAPIRLSRPKPEWAWQKIITGQPE